MRTRAIRMARRVALFALGWILLNYPILAIFNVPDYVQGLPLLYVYLFAVWLLLIVLIARVVRKHDTPLAAAPTPAPKSADL